MANDSLKRDLVAYVRSLGFSRVGITSADPLNKEETFLKSWLAEGRAGDMAYLKREPERRARPTELLPGARSVIALAMSYSAPSSSSPAVAGRGSSHAVQRMDSPPEAAENDVQKGSIPDVPEGRLARYAWGWDYHAVIRKRLLAFTRYLEALAPNERCKIFVDTGPLLERALAHRAGLGFIGKNTMLITRGLGSWVFLAHVITTLDLPLDAPDERSCGECRLCIEACPTGAIAEPFVLDARRCIAYLTIELDGSINQELRGKTGGWVFGCDMCQEVCPHNKLKRAGERMSGGLKLKEILEINDDADFHKHFAGTALMRAGRAGLLRNACVAAANLGRNDLIPRLEKLSRNDSSPIVREYAAWALERLGGAPASPVPLASIPDPARS